MKKIVAVFLILAMGISTASAFAQGFNDIAGHWAEEEILSAVEQNIVHGDGTGNFRPNDKVTRAEFVKMVSAAVVSRSDMKEIPDSFKKEDTWYSKYVNFAYSYYLIRDLDNKVDGVNPGVIKAEDAQKEISRWEMAYITASAMNVLLSISDTENAPKFNDMEEIEEMPGAIPFTIELTSANGVIKGTDKNEFLPMGVGTRAEATVIVSRLAKIIDSYLTTATEETVNNKEEASLNIVTYKDSEIPKENVKVKFTMENGKSFTVETYPKFAPQTVANFIKLVNDGFYNGLTFHRVVDGFMAQGGDPLGTGMGGSGNNIFGEFAANGFEKNTLSHKRGVISMARSNVPDSASSQFFICYNDATFLDGSYAAFGMVIDGMETVDEFLKVERKANELGELAVPTKPIIIKSVNVIK